MNDSYIQDAAIRCEWGLAGVTTLAASSDAMIIVDVLSFSTCVAVATERGAQILPFRWRDERAETFAAEQGALLAGMRGSGSFSLSPASLIGLEAGMRLVLPSPNGATLSLASGTTPTLAGCLRNAQTVAAAAQRFGKRISVVPAGERWPDGSLRPGIEDWIGAGAIIHALSGERSPEALMAEHAFLSAQADLSKLLHACSSGRELLEKGFAEDIHMAAALDQSTAAPLLSHGVYAAV